MHLFQTGQDGAGQESSPGASLRLLTLLGHGLALNDPIVPCWSGQRSQASTAVAACWKCAAHFLSAAVSEVTPDAVIYLFLLLAQGLVPPSIIPAMERDRERTEDWLSWHREEAGAACSSRRKLGFTFGHFMDHSLASSRAVPGFVVAGWVFALLALFSVCA